MSEEPRIVAGRVDAERPAGWQFSGPAVFAREATAWVFGGVLAWLVRGPMVTGREHLAELVGPFVVCPNHASHFDSSTLRLALRTSHRRRLAVAAAADYFWRSRILAFFASWLGSFPFKRLGSGHESITMIEQLLAAGWNVLIYPEGTRSRSGEMGGFKAGVGLVAVRTGVPVLPVHIVGLHEVLPPGSIRPRRRKVEVRFGPPMRAIPGEDPRSFTARLEAAVRAL